MSDNRYIISEQCPTCGGGVLPHRGRLYNPLQGRFIHGNLMSRPARVETGPGFTYVEHVCKAEDIEEHEARREQVIRRLEQTVTALQEQHGDLDPQVRTKLDSARRALAGSREDLRQLIVDTSLSKPCPKCGVGIGTFCENLVERGKGHRVPTRNPHSERNPLAASVEAAEIHVQAQAVGAAADQVSRLEQAIEHHEQTQEMSRLLDVMRNIVF